MTESNENNCSQGVPAFDELPVETIQLHNPSLGLEDGFEEKPDVDADFDTASKTEPQLVEVTNDEDSESSDASGPEFVAQLLRKQQDVIDQLGNLGDQIDSFIDEITASRKQADQASFESESRDGEDVVEAA